ATLPPAVTQANPGIEWQKKTWLIEHPMPGYLFALVAGKFDKITDTFVKGNGEQVRLEAYADPGNGPRASVAMLALKEAMAFDERVFNFTYPFGYMKMAGVSAFNAGAMENNTLIIFNDQRYLADLKYSTDDQTRDVAKVSQHEYFHTFTGNEVTI